ncbi:CHASE domain-containing protein [Candidatus Saccharibacteria bacterium]|nr:CHASE domain-containing protein [Candidatus Saccharibacteria bacterium]
MKKKLHKYVLMISGVSFVLMLILLVAWLTYFKLELLELPADYRYSADVVSYDNLYDEDKQQFTGETRSQTTFAYQGVGEHDGVVEVKNTFDVRTIDDMPIFSVERLYGIDHETREHVSGHGDIDRKGYLFAPKGNNRNNFTYWHVNYNQPIDMRFQESETILGLDTDHYTSSFTADQTNELGNLPGVGVTRGVTLNVILDLWIEPVTGELVKYEDSARAYYYDLATGQQQSPWNQFHNNYSFDAVARHVALAESRKQQTQVIQEVVPAIIAMVTVLLGATCVTLYSRQRHHDIKSQTLFCLSFVILASVISLGAWILHEVSLIAPFGLGAGMHYATIGLFVFSAIVALHTATQRRGGARGNALYAVMISTIAVVSLANLLNVVIRGTELFVSDIARMSVATSINFILVATSLIILRSSSRKRWVTLIVSGAIAALVFICLLSLISIAYNLSVLDSASWIRAMSLPTTSMFLMLAFALYPLQHERDAIFGWRPTQVALLFFIAPVLLLGLVWRGARNDVTNNANLQFETEINKIEGLITQRLSSYANSLLGANSLISASEEVTRDEWRSYVDGLQIAKNYPGNQGIGYSVVVPAAERQSFEEGVQSEGFPDFEINPVEPERELYTSILYLEPFDERNQRAFGYDMFSEQTRRTAMSAARDTGDVALSGKVTLLQETNADVQAGFLIYTPVYKKGVQVNNQVQRRANIEGYVYSPVRMDNFMDAAVGNQSTGVNIEIFDAPAADLISEDARMYGASRPVSGLPQKTNVVTVAGHQWVIKYTALPVYASNTTEQFPQYILVGGILASGLLAIAVYSLASSRKRAYKLAENITHDLKQERNLAVKNQKKDDAILTSIGEGVIVTSQSGVVEFVNRYAEKLLKISNTELSGKKLIHSIQAQDLKGKIISSQNRPAFRAYSQKRVVNTRVNYKISSGALVPVEVTVAPIIQNDKVIGLIEVFRDISARLELESAKDDFMSIVSHQLNTPATAVKQFLGLLLEGYFGEIPKEQQELVKKAFDSNEEQITIIQDLLTTARLEAGKSNLEKELFKALPFVNGVVRMLSSKAKKRDVSIKVDVPSSAVLYADKIKLRMCLSNLIDNAIKYNKPNGTVDISVTSTNKCSVVSVRDTGIGIHKSDIPKLFLRFSRVAKRTDEPVTGNGLGLYLVKKIVTLHKGVVEVTSKQDVGTTFVIKLPRKDKS